MHDVAIIGAGPVGLTTAALLGDAGLDVVVVERFPDPFGLPRAIRFDHEVMRIWQELGIAEGLLGDALPVERYEWYGADRQLIVAYDMPPAPSGWAFSYVFYQPHLESALQDAVDAHPNVVTRRGFECVSLREHDDHVELGARRSDVDGAEVEPIRARYLVGADGARSTVRDLLGIDERDAGFGERWFVVDVRPRDDKVAERFESFPLQFCDPARPHMLGPNGRTHRRWEFMLLPGEDAADFEDPRRAWSLLAPWLEPSEGTIVRSAVYEFRAAVAASMRGGRRCFLAGDAAHRMPPHLGEGMCSGIRDAKAIAWRLALVLHGGADERLLDSYSSERLPHARALVDQSLAMGRVSCERDPELARRRDERLRAAGGVEPWPFPALGPGLRYRGRRAVTELAGRLSVQGTVEQAERSGRFDDVVGRGFVLLLDGANRAVLDERRAAGFRACGGRVVALGHDVADVDGRLSAWLRSAGAAAAVIRPDFYVFGAVTAAAEVPALIDDLLAQVGATRRPIHDRPPQREEHHVHHR